MAVAVRAIGTVGQATSTTVPANYPAGVLVNDILILSVTARSMGSTETVTTPAGWTLLARQDATANSSNAGAYVFWKRAAGTETGSFNLTTSSAIAWVTYITAVTGVRTTANPYAHTATGSLAATTRPATAALTFDTGGTARAGVAVVVA